MSLFNPLWITDLHVLDISEREDITTQLELLDIDIIRTCISKGVPEDDIQVDNEGFITSSPLIEYAIVWINAKLLSDYRGGAMGEIEDIYKDKMMDNRSEASRYKNMLTQENILGVNLTQKSYISQVQMY